MIYFNSLSCNIKGPNYSGRTGCKHTAAAQNIGVSIRRKVLQLKKHTTLFNMWLTSIVLTSVMLTSVVLC